MDKTICKTKEEVRKKVNEIICQCLCIKNRPDFIIELKDLSYSLNCDSLDTLEIYMQIEKEFGLKEYIFEKPEVISTINGIVNKICEEKEIKV